MSYTNTFDKKIISKLLKSKRKLKFHKIVMSERKI
jgi:hypothetical protein